MVCFKKKNVTKEGEKMNDYFKTVILFLLIILIGCASFPVLDGEYEKVVIYENYGKEKVGEILETERIEELVSVINKSPKKDVSEIIWEMSPDGTMEFQSEEVSIELTFFTYQSIVNLYWYNDDKIYIVKAELDPNELVGLVN